MTPRKFTAILEKEGDGFVAICPELDVVSQGDTVEEARANLKEAVELFLETASEQEVRERLHSEVVGTTALTRRPVDPGQLRRVNMQGRVLVLAVGRVQFVIS